jgi:signal transduction histidine kinase
MADTLRVLMVEDSEADAELILRALGRGGLRVSSRRVETAGELRAALAAETWHAVLADFNLPHFDALAALALVRAVDCDVPFIVVSGTIGEETAVEMMRAGAQDYVLKDNLTRLAVAVQRELGEAEGRRERRAAETEVQVHQERLRALAAEVTWAEQKERRRIATGLHDDICQTLAVAKMKLEQTRRLPSAEERAQGYDELGLILDGVIQETRNLVYELSPPILFELGLTKAIAWVADKAREQYDLPVEVVVEGEVKPLADDVAVTVFQAVKELLNNVVKHAEATRVTIEIAPAPRELRVSVTDDGVGCEEISPVLHSGGGFGLLNIRERLTYVGGALDLQSSPGRGCRALIVVPAGRGSAGAE